MQKQILWLLLWLNLATWAVATPQGTEFSYQGYLTANGVAANGNYDITVKIFDADINGLQLGPGQTFSNVGVDEGVFLLQLDFGDMPFSGDQVWIELEVKAASDSNFITLTPRQLITNTPYAIQSQFVGLDGVNSASVEDGSIQVNDLATASISTDKLVAGAVTSDKLAASAVTSSAIQNGAVTQDKIATAAVGSNQIVSDAVTTGKIQNFSVTDIKLAANAVDSSKIADGSIIGSDIQVSTITSLQLGNDSVGLLEMADDSIGSPEIRDNSITADDVDSSTVQVRVTGECLIGSSIRAINSDGTVFCETDDLGSFSGWALTGNSGTTNTNFIGTSDNRALTFKVNNVDALRIFPKNVVGETTPSWIAGAASNNISSNIAGSAIAGGKNNSISSSTSQMFSIIGGGSGNSIVDNNGLDISHNVISGGRDNDITESSHGVIGGGSSNSISGAWSVISGGRSNSSGFFSSVGGGDDNQALGTSATVPGGFNNQAGGDFSFAAGRSASVRNAAQSGDSDGDEGTFVWASGGSVFQSTGPRQFLIDATGGIGVGTNQPVAPLHLSGVGSSAGSTPNSQEVLMLLEPQNNSDNAALVLNPSTGNEAALIFAENTQIQHELRSISSTRGVVFNQYDANNNRTILLRMLNDTNVQRADFNMDVEPLTDGNFNLGSSGFRWNTIFATNPVNVSSDARLKSNIQDLDYGLAEVLALRPVSYNWKRGDSKAYRLGLIAQEVEKLVPEIVDQNGMDNMRSMRYTELLPVLIKATQEQQILIEQQQQEISELKALVEQLVQQVSHE